MPKPASRVQPQRRIATRNTSEKPDASLLALLPKIEAADRASDAAFAILGPAEKTYQAKSRPRPTEPRREPFPTIDSEQDRQIRLAVGQWARERENDPKRLAHKAEVRRWQNRCSKLAIRCGLRDAERRSQEAQDKVVALGKKVARTQAETLRGLIFKARYSAEHYPAEYDIDVARSIVDDLLAMQGREIADG